MNFFKKSQGIVQISAGYMSAFIKISDEAIYISAENFQPENRKFRFAKTTGDLNEFISVAQGKSPILAFLNRKIRISNNLFFAYKFSKLFK